MRVLFTFLSVYVNDNLYLNASKKLANEILTNTPYDVLITTNNISYFNDIKNDRIAIRNNIPENSVLTYRDGCEFNFNLKYLSFKDLPETYDVIFYVDGDIKNIFWNDLSENKLKILIEKYDWIATRLNCVLKNEVNQYKETGNTLFAHKIKSYDVLNWDFNDNLMESRLPSEHFLIFKYDKEKINKFANKWSELNSILQDKNGGNGSWGDGFEIGLSARYAGYDNMFDLNYRDLHDYLGFVFNGNKI